MVISDQQLDAFIDIYRNKFGVILDRQSAYNQASALVQMVSIVCFAKTPIKQKINEQKYKIQTTQDRRLESNPRSYDSERRDQ